MEGLIIRKETEADYKQTEFMTRRAFWNRHGAGCDEHLLVHKIRMSEAYLPEISRIAELDGKIVGAIFYTKSHVIDGDRVHEIITFGPLCADPMVQNLGIGKRLLEETCQLARAAGYPGICILGEPGYYPKRGFRTCDHFGITDMQGKNYDALMGYELVKDGFAAIKGRFKEADVFEMYGDLEELEEFDKQFPPYPKLEFPSQWLHKENLASVIEIRNDVYTLQYWEAVIQAGLSEHFDGKRPSVGDYVTFQPGPQGGGIIQTVESPVFILAAEKTDLSV